MDRFHKINHLDPCNSVYQDGINHLRITPHHVVPTPTSSSSSNVSETQQPFIDNARMDSISSFVDAYNIFSSNHTCFNVEVVKPPEEQWDDVPRYGRPIPVEHAFFALTKTHADIVLFSSGSEYIINSEGFSGLLFNVAGTIHNPREWPKFLRLKFHQGLNVSPKRCDQCVPIKEVSPFKARLVPVSGFQSCSRWPARFFYLIYESQASTIAMQLPGYGNLSLFFCLYVKQVARWEILTPLSQPIIISFESPLQYHTSTQMDFSGIRIQDIMFINAFSSLVLMVSAGLRRTRCKFNRPFYLILNVLSDCEADAVVKIFIGPFMNENIVEAREHLIEVDSFHYHLVAGLNEIVRLPFNSIRKAQALVDAIDKKQPTNRAFLLFAHIGRFPTRSMRIAPRNYYPDTYYPEGYPLDKTIKFEWLFYRANSFLGTVNFIKL